MLIKCTILCFIGYCNSLEYLIKHCGIVVAMFSISLISHGVLDQKFHNSIPSSVKTVHDQIDQFSVTSPYGLFRRSVMYTNNLFFTVFLGINHSWGHVLLISLED